MMQHANKMILVPHDIGQKEGIAKNIMSDLDKEMNKILENQSLPVDTKALLYNQVSRRYMQAMQEHAKPFELKIEQEEPSKPEEKVEAPRDDFYKKALTFVPKKWHHQAQLLYDYAMKNPHLKWTDKGEMIVNGNKIVGSNIIDLISDVARTGSNRAPALGADVFVKSLLKENVPQNVFVNKTRIKAGSESEEFFASPIDADASTPRQNTKRKHNIKKWQALKV